jgi:hypothetical protein
MNDFWITIFVLLMGLLIVVSPLWFPRSAARAEHDRGTGKNRPYYDWIRAP